MSGTESATDLVKALGVDEVHDLGIQLVCFDDGVEGLAYITCCYWTCEERKAVTTVTSKVDRLLVVALAGGQAEPMRMKHDQDSIALSRASHRCQQTPGVALFHAKPVTP